MSVLSSVLVTRLRARGVAVVELAGWQSRGETDGPFAIRGVILHHDGMGLANNNVAEYMSQNGNDGAQLWVKRDGTVFFLAGGRKWHAGTGSGWRSIPANCGNSYAVGIETDWTFGHVWTTAMRSSIVILTRELVNQYGLDVNTQCCGHREYAPGRKPDPADFNLDEWRAQVLGTAITPIVKPAPPVAPKPIEDDMKLNSLQVKGYGAVFVYGPGIWFHVGPSDWASGKTRAFFNPTPQIVTPAEADVRQSLALRLAGLTVKEKASAYVVRTAPKPAAVTKCTVVKGDTLGALAAKYKVSTAQLVAWNKLPNGGNDIDIGQVLVVSGK